MNNLVGRERECKELERCLYSNRSELVIVSGSPNSISENIFSMMPLWGSDTPPLIASDMDTRTDPGLDSL